METFYKVVKVDLTSCFVTGKAAVQYKVGEYVKPPEWLPPNHQVLFVFLHLKEAHDFITRVGGNLHTYECQVTNTLALPHYLDCESLSLGSIHCSVFEDFPTGTVAVQQVRLIKEIG